MQQLYSVHQEFFVRAFAVMKFNHELNETFGRSASNVELRELESGDYYATLGMMLIKNYIKVRIKANFSLADPIFYNITKEIYDMENGTI